MAQQALVAGPVLYQLSNTQALIWWQTDITSTVQNYISYWSPGPVTPISVVAKQVRQYSSTGAELFFYYAVLTGLTAGTLYYYTVNGDQLTTPTKLFSTYSTATSTKLGIFGNSGANYGASLPGLGYTLTTLLAQGCIGFLGTGGYTQNGSVYESWRDQWVTPTASTFASYGFSGCRGQQDGYSLAPSLMPYIGDSQDTFELSIGAARIVALNSVSLQPRLSLASGGTQSDWFQNYAIKRSEWKSASYRIILVHQPDRVSYWNAGSTYGDSGGADTYLTKNLYPLLQASGADLILFGASSSYQRGVIQSTYSTSQHMIHHVNVAGGGTYKHASKVWNWSAPNQPSMQFESSDYIGGILTISPSSLQLDAYDFETSSIVDSVSVPPHVLV